MDKQTLSQKVKKTLDSYPEILLCIVFGSVLTDEETFESDLDIAVSADKELNSAQITNLIEDLAQEFGRPVDLIDLQVTSGALLHQILTKGTKIFCTDETLYAEIIKKMFFNQSDMMPYYNRTLKERRERWINK